MLFVNNIHCSNFELSKQSLCHSFNEFHCDSQFVRILIWQIAYSIASWILNQVVKWLIKHVVREAASLGDAAELRHAPRRGGVPETPCRGRWITGAVGYCRAAEYQLKLWEPREVQTVNKGRGKRLYNGIALIASGHPNAAKGNFKKGE